MIEVEGGDLSLRDHMANKGETRMLLFLTHHCRDDRRVVAPINMDVTLLV